MSKRQKCDPLSRKCVKNAYPRAEMGVIDITRRSQSLCSEGAILNPLSLLLLDLALPVANKLVLTSDRVYLYACITHEICFCAPEGRIAPIGASNRRRVLNRRRVILSRNDNQIPKRLFFPESMISSSITSVTEEEQEKGGGGWLRSCNGCTYAREAHSWIRFVMQSLAGMFL